MRILPASLALLLAACSGAPGPAAPRVTEVAESCVPTFCVSYPADWRIEEGTTFVTLNHPLDPERVLASVGLVDMEALVVANGGSWPSTTENVVRDFWALLGSAQDARLEMIESAPDGSVRSQGRVEDLVMWHVLIPTGAGALAIGAEVRAPNSGWKEHADVIRDGVTPAPP
ncbi:MAG: hypothetical protein ACE5KX_04380 [Acidimicrobiia bacterium]